MQVSASGKIIRVGFDRHDNISLSTVKKEEELNTRPFKSLASLRNVLIFQSTVFFNQDNIK